MKTRTVTMTAVADKLLTRLGYAGLGLAGFGFFAQDGKPWSILYNVDGGQRAVMFNLMSTIDICSMFSPSIDSNDFVLFLERAG